MTRPHLGLALLAALIWGATFPVTKVALDVTPPLFFAALRFLGAALFIAVVPRPRIPWRHLVMLGLFLGAGQYGLMFLGMTRGVAPGMASLLIHVQAFFTVALATMIFHEPLTRRHAAGGILGLAGLALLLLDRGEGLTPIGVGLVLLGAVGGAAGNIVLKGLGKVDMAGVAVWMSLSPIAPLLLLSWQFESPNGLWANVTAIGWVTVAAVVYSACLSTIAGYAIWGRLFARYPATSVAPFLLLVPVFGIALSVALFAEPLTPLRIRGAILILAGIAAATMSETARPTPTVTPRSP